MNHILHARQHIQDHGAADHEEPHWGYASRVVPCVNDQGSCEYLDQVYAAHDLSIVYSWIMWLVLAGVALIWLALRFSAPRNGYRRSRDQESGTRTKPGFLTRLYSTGHAWRRKYLLPESYKFFGTVSRLQVAILVIILTYLLIFSFVGLTYKHWITPIKNSTKKNTRSTLGPWSDRIGILAYALTPICIALSTRESLLSLITGIPYQHFLFLHQWTGRVIYIQSALHTIGWTIIEAKLYQPQPKVYRNFIRQQYMVFGCVAMLFITFLFIFSFNAVIKRTGYEFFRKSHYFVALLYIGACIGHWKQLWPYLVPAFFLWFVDRGVRLLRTGLIHFGRNDPLKKFGFQAAQARLTTFSDADAAVVRLEFEFPHAPWKVGQHFHLCFPSLTVWQSHPMTSASMPRASSLQKHVYIIRALKGETARLAALAAPSSDDSSEKSDNKTGVIVPVVLSGASGGALFRRAGSQTTTNVMAIAGGTGVSFTLPAVEEALDRAERIDAGAVTMVWIIRKARNVEWIAPELQSLRDRLRNSKVDFQIKLYVTRDDQPSSSDSFEHAIIDSEKQQAGDDALALTVPTISNIETLIDEIPGFSIEWLGDHHPNFTNGNSSIIDDWLQRGAAYGGSFHVFCSGPAAMGTDLRIAIAQRNNPSAVWKGQSEGDVEFYWDDRCS